VKYLEKSFKVGGASTAYDDNYERTFAQREANKGKRWVYRTNPETGECEAIEVGADYQPEGRGAGAPATDLYMDGTRATDGTDIGSRMKRREYMRTHGLADADDFKNTWAKAAREREASMQGRDATRREDIARALHQKRKP
jgi:hypothetical protein